MRLRPHDLGEQAPLRRVRGAFRVRLALLTVALAALLLARASPTRLELTQVKSYIAVRNEAPAAAPAGWTLAAAPVAGAACYRNGLRQAPGIDYTLTGNAIASAFWQAGDVLLCDYEHL